jgi:hypothetical protein
MLKPEAAEQVRDLLFELLVPQPCDYSLDPLNVDDVTTLGVSAGYGLSDIDRQLRFPRQRQCVPGSHAFHVGQFV